jgi:16S rRNA (cytosine967-C5)-methyltransferase
MKPFRLHHLFNILYDWEEQEHTPIDRFLRNYFRENKAAGSHDRREIVETLYGMIRWRSLLDYLSEGMPSWEKRFDEYQNLPDDRCKNDPSIPLHIRACFPEEIFAMLVDVYGEERAFELCWESNFPAPTTIRVNTLKISREELLERWTGEYYVEPCEHSKEGIVFKRKINFFALDEFKKGLFEVQDEGSQCVAYMLKAQPGDHVMDYCAGAGGKTLAFAPAMEGKGQIYLHDIRPRALDEARIRLRRAGVQNSQVVHHDAPHLKKLKKKMDWVLVDAPCSGMGTLRRNPDMKWKCSKKMVMRIASEQRVIFERALSFMKPEGRIIYATCSMLPEENEQQMEHFIKTYNLKVEGEPFRSFPAKDGMDGFFAVTFSYAQ